MSRVKDKWTQWINDPSLLRKFHGWSTIIWFAAAFPICIFLANSVPFLVFISVYAVVASEFSSWQSSRVEEKQKKQEDEEEEKRAKDIEEIVQRVDEKTPDR